MQSSVIIRAINGNQWAQLSVQFSGTGYQYRRSLYLACSGQRAAVAESRRLLREFVHTRDPECIRQLLEQIEHPDDHVKQVEIQGDRVTVHLIEEVASDTEIYLHFSLEGLHQMMLDCPGLAELYAL